MTLEENWSFNDFLSLAPCHCPLKHLYNEVGSEEREKLQSKWHSWPPWLTEVVWKSPLSNNSIPTGSCKSPHRPRSPLISISISPCLFSNLYSQEAESPKQGKKYNSFPWTLTALLNMDLNKVFYLYAKMSFFFFFFKTTLPEGIHSLFWLNWTPINFIGRARGKGLCLHRFIVFSCQLGRKFSRACVASDFSHKAHIYRRMQSSPRESRSWWDYEDLLFIL